jgi:F-box protein 18 (helicase)
VGVGIGPTPIPTPTEYMTPTLEQQAVIDATDSALCVKAFAGTGKTATFVARANAHPERSLYLAFNKSVEQEAKQRFPSHVLAKTTHALAYAAIIGRSGKYTLGKLSVFKTAKMYRLDFYMASLIHKTIENFCNSADFEMGKVHVSPDAIGRYQHDTTDVILDFAKKVWALVLDGKNPDFPMTHSGYLKLYQLSKPILKYDTIFLDEAQDTSPCVHDIVMSQVPNSHVIACGDNYQAIYQWRGATDSLQKIKARVLYLSQSFRFGKEIASVANVILGTFFGETRSLEGLGPAGEILDGRMPVDPPLTYLSRTNAHLFAQACGMAGKMKIYTPSSVFGTLPMFDDVMNVYNLFRNMKQEIRDPELKHFQDYWELLEFVKTGNADPNYNVAVAVVEKYKDGVPVQIENIKRSLVPTPDQAQVTLITAHRSKGLEWDNVVLCNDFCPLFDEETGKLKNIGPNRSTHVPADEVNLLYVAATRAKRRLKPNADLDKLIKIRS